MTLIESGRYFQLPANPRADQPDLTFKNVSTSGSATIKGTDNTIDGSADYTLESLACVTLRWVPETPGWIVLSAY